MSRIQWKKVTEQQVLCAPALFSKKVCKIKYIKKTGRIYTKKNWETTKTDKERQIRPKLPKSWMKQDINMDTPAIKKIIMECDEQLYVINSTTQEM